MHMADALVSPVIGGTMWAASAATVAVSSRRVQQGTDDRRVPLMGVLGAFVFAAQMMNFQLPGTGSSGHVGGALLLSILLGPHAAFLVVVSILAIQALLFGDGGLLALGCNAFNMGFFPAFVAYPLVYRPLAPAGATPARRLVGAIAAAEIGLALGAFGVVFETTLSGISDLPFRPFLTAMIPVHLAIGLVEGAVTAGVLTFVLKTRPDVVDPASSPAPTTTSRLGAAFLAVALLVGGALSWFASTKPDGLEWSIARVTGRAGPVRPGATRAAVSLAGIGGGLATLALVSATGWALRRRR